MLICFERIQTKNCRTEEVLALVRDFEDCTLPVLAWNRETYLTIAYWYLYLNPLAEAEQQLDLSLMRYSFEKGLDSPVTEIIAGPGRHNLLRTLNKYIAIYKSQKSFAELASLILDQFANEDSFDEMLDQPALRYARKVRRVFESKQLGLR